MTTNSPARSANFSALLACETMTSAWQARPCGTVTTSGWSSGWRVRTWAYSNPWKTPSWSFRSFILFDSVSASGTISTSPVYPVCRSNMARNGTDIACTMAGWTSRNIPWSIPIFRWDPAGASCAAPRDAVETHTSIATMIVLIMRPTAASFRHLLNRAALAARSDNTVDSLREERWYDPARRHPLEPEERLDVVEHGLDVIGLGP